MVYDIPGAELSHWGIKGMRWGVRKYQNPDGTLTEAGKARYDKYEAKEKKRRDRQKVKQPWRNMSDEQLTRETNRLNRETNYYEALNRNRQASANKAADWAKKVALGAAASVATALLVKGANKVLDKGVDWAKAARAAQVMATRMSMVAIKR